MLEPLYPEKQAVLEKINRFFLTNRIGYIKLPTGWGKTFLSKHLIKQYYEWRQITLFIVSQNNNLLKQTAYITEDKPLFPNSYVLCSDIKGEIDRIITTIQSILPQPCVVFASLQSILSKKNETLRRLLAEKVNLVIIDEIHNFIKNKGNQFIAGINSNAKVLGMTATPFQGTIGNEKHVKDIDSDMVEIHKESLPECIDKNILSKLSYNIIYNSQKITDMFDFTKGIDTFKKELILDCSTQKKIDQLIIRTKLAKKTYDSNVLKFCKTLVFCAPCKGIVNLQEERIPTFHAKLTAMIFNDELLPSYNFSNYDLTGKLKDTVYLSGDMSKREKYEIITGFKNPLTTPYTLCTIGMLVEGFDFPNLQNLLLLRPSLSIRLFEQQLGRILRIPNDNSKSQGNIFEIVDNKEGLYSLFKNQIFNKHISEQIEMLNPKIKIERLFYDKGYNRSNNISIQEMVYQNGLIMPVSPTNYGILHLKRLLNIILRQRYGSLYREYPICLAAASNIKIYNIEDINDITEIISKIDSWSQNVNKYADSNNHKLYKNNVWQAVKAMLKLNIYKSIDYIDISSIDKKKILRKLELNNININEYIKQHSGISTSLSTVIQYTTSRFKDEYKKEKQELRYIAQQWIRHI
ncbi:MAG: DEAD/DEAH box helicase [Elusimicrobiota bacterium]